MWTMEEINLGAIFYTEGCDRLTMIEALKRHDPNLTENILLLDLIYNFCLKLEALSDAEFETCKDMFMMPAYILAFEE